MILTAHQPNYLPWLGLFHKISLADVFVSFDATQYEPKTWTNRAQVKTADGPLMLSVPVLRKGYREKPMYELRINDQPPWRRKHWQTITNAYGKAPHFDELAPFFEELYEREWETLADLNEHVIRWVLDRLGIEVRLERARDHDFKGGKSDLVLDMALSLGADTYIFGSGGRDYADVEAFADAGVRAVFQEYRHPVYPQLHGEFVPYLSVIDLLFNCGPESREIVLNGQPEPRA